MSRTRRIAALAAVAIALVLLAVLGDRSTTPGTDAARLGDASSGVPSRIGAPGGAGAMRSEGGRPGATSRPATPTRDAALARAYAALGAADDGDRKRLEALDDEARERLDDARLLLDTGASARDRAPDAATPTASGGPATVPPASAHPPGAMRLDLAQAVDARHAVRPGTEGPELLARGVWAKSSYRPDRLPRLVITDRTGGGYAVRLHGDDFGTIRLDGGLVVPGRFYRVDGAAVVTGDAPCSVDIRPLEAVPGTDLVARPPEGNG